jgi:hypothetical protein
VILEKVRETIIQHDGRGEVCRHCEMDSANILLDAEVRVICLDEEPLRLGCTGGVGRRKGCRDKAGWNFCKVVCIGGLYAICIVYGNLLDLQTTKAVNLGVLERSTGYGICSREKREWRYMAYL